MDRDQSSASTTPTGVTVHQASPSIDCGRKTVNCQISLQRVLPEVRNVHVFQSGQAAARITSSWRMLNHIANTGMTCM